VDDIEAQLGLPALGVLRLVPRSILRRGPKLPRRSEVESAVDGILAALTVLNPERARRRIVVTSVGHHDSAAAVASLIASGLARHQIRTTLLEGQRRLSGVRRYLKGVAAHTVEEILASRRGKPEPLVVIASDSVTGYLGSSSRGRIGALIDALAASGDHVVATAAPVLANTDLATFARHADVVLLVVASDQARKAEASRAALLVSRLGVPLAGLVVIGGAAHVDGWQRGSWPPMATGFAQADLTNATRVGQRVPDATAPIPRLWDDATGGMSQAVNTSAN
jgi:Mrp family chromosome partitioning ATPase